MQIQIRLLLQKPTDLDLHCLQRQDKGKTYPGSAGLGLILHKLNNVIWSKLISRWMSRTKHVSALIWDFSVQIHAKDLLGDQAQNSFYTQIGRLNSAGLHSTGWVSDCKSRGHKFNSAIYLWKLFLRSFSPFHWFKKGSCKRPEKECAQELDKHLED